MPSLRQSGKLPAILSRAEVQQIIAHATNAKLRARHHHARRHSRTAVLGGHRETGIVYAKRPTTNERPLATSVRFSMR